MFTCKRELSSSEPFATLALVLYSSSLWNCFLSETLTETGFESTSKDSDKDFLPEPCCSIADARFCLATELTERWEEPLVSWLAKPLVDERFSGSKVAGPLLGKDRRLVDNSFFSMVSTSTCIKILEGNKVQVYWEKKIQTKIKTSYKPDLMAPFWIPQKQQENPFLCAAQALSWNPGNTA